MWVLQARPDLQRKKRTRTRTSPPARREAGLGWLAFAERIPRHSRGKRTTGTQRGQTPAASNQWRLAPSRLVRHCVTRPTACVTRWTPAPLYQASLRPAGAKTAPADLSSTPGCHPGGKSPAGTARVIRRASGKTRKSKKQNHRRNSPPAARIAARTTPALLTGTDIQRSHSPPSSGSPGGYPSAPRAAAALAPSPTHRTSTCRFLDTCITPLSARPGRPPITY